jgi:predicted ATPase
MEKSKIIVLAAESGIGKSSLMAAIARDLEELKHPGLHVFFHFVGCTNLSNYVERLILFLFVFIDTTLVFLKIFVLF